MTKIINGIEYELVEEGEIFILEEIDEEIDEEVESARKKGKLFTCRLCGYQFNFDTEEEKAEWKKNRLICPECGEEYCNKPESEILLFKLQNKFIETIDDFLIEKNPHLIDMYFILVDYSLSLLYKYYIGKIQSNTMAKYYAERSATIFIEKYLKDNNFRVTDSFGGLLVSKGRKGIISQACFGKEEKDLDADSINIENEKGQQIDYADSKIDLIDQIEQRETTLNNFNYIIKLIESLKDYCNSDFEDFIRITAFDMFLTRGERATDNFFRLLSEKLGTDGKIGKEMFMKTLEILRIELKNMCE